MSEGQELERVERVPDVARIRVTKDEAAAMVRQVREVIDGVLQSGRDYMVIPGTGSKPSMLLPGAQRLQAFFGLGSRYAGEEMGWDPSGAFYCRVKCQVTNRDGDVIAESWGWCDDSEKGKGDKPKWRGNRNTIVKMAQKRAFVGAVLTATATADHFTQDVEDQQAGAVDPAQPAAAANLPKHMQDRPIEGPEANAFIRIYGQVTGRTEEESTEALYKGYKLPGNPPQPSYIWTARQVLRLLALPPEKANELRTQAAAERAEQAERDRDAEREHGERVDEEKRDRAADERAAEDEGETLEPDEIQHPDDDQPPEGTAEAEGDPS